MPVNRLKRNKGLIILLLPIFVCIFMVGWLMYWTGEPRGKTKHKTTEQITIGSIILEENGKIKVK